MLFTEWLIIIGFAYVIAGIGFSAGWLFGVFTTWLAHGPERKEWKLSKEEAAIWRKPSL